MGYKPLQLLFSHPIFSILRSLFSSYLPPHLPPKKIRSVGGFCLFYSPSIMEDGVSWSDRAWPVQEMGLVNEARGRTDVTEPDMWRHTALRVQALGFACNTCFPYCLFIASWTSQSIGKNTEKKNKGRRLLFLLAWWHFCSLEKHTAHGQLLQAGPLTCFRVWALIGDTWVLVTLYSSRAFGNKS